MKWLRIHVIRSLGLNLLTLLLVVQSWTHCLISPSPIICINKMWIISKCYYEINGSNAQKSIWLGKSQLLSGEHYHCISGTKYHR